VTDSSIYRIVQISVLKRRPNEDQFRLPVLPVRQNSFIKVENEFRRDKRNPGLDGGEGAIPLRPRNLPLWKCLRSDDEPPNVIDMP
jgi:hypothetical protein